MTVPFNFTEYVKVRPDDAAFPTEYADFQPDPEQRVAADAIVDAFVTAYMQGSAPDVKAMVIGLQGRGGSGKTTTMGWVLWRIRAWLFQRYFDLVAARDEQMRADAQAAQELIDRARQSAKKDEFGEAAFATEETDEQAQRFKTFMDSLSRRAKDQKKPSAADRAQEELQSAANEFGFGGDSDTDLEI